METKAFLSNMFEMKDMGEADLILGIKIIRDNNKIILSQEHYVDKIVSKFAYDKSNEITTPFDSNVVLKKNDDRPKCQLEYAQVIGSLMYAMTCTRPDIAYAVSKLSQFTSNPGEAHWCAIRRVLRYLKNTSKLGLTYCGEPSVLEGFADASWIDISQDHTSTSGYVYTLAGGAISWKSKKQTCIADSTMVAEFIALETASKEAEWLKDLIHNIPLWSKPIPPIAIHCDSQSALAKAYSDVYNGKSRHIGRRHSSVRQLITDGIISIDYVRSNKNLADPLTKPLTRMLFDKTSKGMGLCPINSNRQ
jgi:hypothetical protein